MQRENPNIAVVAISLDQDDATYRAFLTRHHVDLVTIRDESGRINSLYGTSQIPETYVIDGNGILRRKFRFRPELDQPRDYRLPQEAFCFIGRRLPRETLPPFLFVIPAFLFVIPEGICFCRCRCFFVIREGN